MSSKKKPSGKKKKSAADEAKGKKSDNDIEELDLNQEGLGANQIVLPDIMPVLPAKDIVGFPAVLMSLYVGREKSIEAIQRATQQEKLIFLLAQKDAEEDEPAVDGLYTMGVVASIVRTLKTPDGRYKILLQGIVRGQIEEYVETKSVFMARVDVIEDPGHLELSAEDEVIINRIRENLQVLVEYEHLPEEILLVTEEIDDPGMLADVVLAHYRLEIPDAQKALELIDPLERLRLTDQHVTDDLNQFLVVERIRAQARDELTKDQKDYYLKEQIKLLRRELGEEDSGPDDLEELKGNLVKLKLPDVARKEVDRQLKRLERMHTETSEYSLLRTYLEWVADLPWNKKTRERLKLDLAEEILNQEHFGLEKVKDRILEYLSVRKLKKDPKGPILCFVGPPGVGKTSLGKSIASALNRKFFRMSLGGIRDEAEIRGHRRTYVGALPGRLIQGLKQAGSKNALFVLDELDKVGADFRGDPSAALLEVLDPQQNKEFVDHYLNLPFDLSEIIFIATANTVDTIPDALLDRLEVIRISGYTTEEKLEIARQHLLPRQLDENGLKSFELEFDSAALQLLIERYTREAGVRNLEREIGSVCRKVAREYAQQNQDRDKVDVEFVKSALGPTRFDPEVDERKDEVGLVRGLAWTRVGGEILLIEASTARGKGELALTGQLGDVMQESCRAALFYARSNARLLGLEADFHSLYDFHIHVPGGATPKDGPSAGIAIVTALVSVLSNRKVSKDVAMTGEITLRGNVLPIGGLKEKALAALRYGIKKVIIPYENVKDLEEVPKEQREQIKFIPVKHVREVLEIALTDRRITRKSTKKSMKKGGRSKGQIIADA